MSPTASPARNNGVQIELPRSLDAAAIARGVLDDRFGAVLGGAIGAARLIVTELVSNAVLHGEGRIGLDLRVEDGRMCIEVVDEGTGQVPAIRESTGDGEPGGWGLQIVDTLAGRWGAHEGTTHVWAELELG